MVTPKKRGKNEKETKLFLTVEPVLSLQCTHTNL